MSVGGEVPSAGRDADAEVVAAQLGRAPRGDWSVTVRCGWDRPVAVVVAPRLEGGEPFPTCAWLTCPWLVEAIGDIESAGGCAQWAERVAGDRRLASAVMAADAAYRTLRAELGGGEDPCSDVGVAGQADPTAVKCLHARVAARLAGVADPVGEGVLEALAHSGSGLECPDDLCAPRSPGRDAERGVG